MRAKTDQQTVVRESGSSEIDYSTIPLAEFRTCPWRMTSSILPSIVASVFLSLSCVKNPVEAEKKCEVNRTLSGQLVINPGDASTSVNFPNLLSIDAAIQDLSLTLKLDVKHEAVGKTLKIALALQASDGTAPQYGKPQGVNQTCPVIEVTPNQIGQVGMEFKLLELAAGDYAVYVVEAEGVSGNVFNCTQKTNGASATVTNFSLTGHLPAGACK